MAVKFGNRLPMSVSFCDNPVGIDVVLEAKSFPEKSTMRKIEMRVYRTFPTDEYEIITWEPDDDSKAASSYYIDLQCALRALLHDVDIDPNTLRSSDTLPIMLYAVVLGRSYLLNGVWESTITENNGYATGGDAEYTGLYVVRGRLTDAELRQLTEANSWPTKEAPVLLSRKPGMETVCPGAMCVSATMPKSTLVPQIQYDEVGVVTKSAAVVSITTAEQASGVYIDDVQQHMYREFFFINSLGAPETVCARTLETRSVVNETNTFERDPGDFMLDRRGRYITVQQHPSQVQMQMSSGACTAEWAEWWATEFLTARRWWMRMPDKTWQPVRITPKSNEQTIYDMAKSEAPHVDFTVVM